MKIEKLKDLLDIHFAPPFVDAGLVSTKWVMAAKGTVLEIKIGPRDIWIDEDGDVVGAGTRVKDGEEEAE